MTKQKIGEKEIYSTIPVILISRKSLPPPKRQHFLSLVVALTLIRYEGRSRRVLGLGLGLGLELIQYY